MPTKIVFIGAGRMASAIVRGLLDKQHYLPEEIACTSGPGDSGTKLAAETGIRYYPDITEAASEAETILIACKPQQLGQLAPELSEASSGSLVLSVLAGTTLKRLKARFPAARNIVRTMPNTPGQIGAGVTAYTPLSALDAAEQSVVENVLRSLGHFYQVEERELDAVTAVSGSGPAYVFEFCAALREAGVQAGLDATLSNDLAIQTLLGASKLLAQSSGSAEDLRNAVTSPGGTTAAALKVFSDSDLRGIVARAIESAKSRSIELGQS